MDIVFSAAISPPPSIGLPRTSTTLPITASPTGTFMVSPLLSQAVPHKSPSVDSSAIQRTAFSEICAATSM